MKKTPLKRGTKSLKRSKLKKVSKQKISTLQVKLWELCKQIIRKRYGNTCYTCLAKNLESSNWHTGHMWAKASLGAYLKYDLRILRPQCYKCNIHHGGRGADFYVRMSKEISEEEMEILKQDRNKTVKAYDHYQKLIKDYTEVLAQLSV